MKRREAGPELEGLREVVGEAVRLYNRYRSPEATARPVKVSEDELVVEFEGSFCASCGLVDWIEDLAYILEDLGVKARLVGIRDRGGTVVGVFRVAEGR